jgi:hypothetical protein
MRYQVVEDSYVAFHGADEDELFDEQEEELNVNWCVLIARVTAIFILVCVVVSFSLGKLDKRLFKLGKLHRYIDTPILLTTSHSTLLFCPSLCFSC